MFFEQAREHAEREYSRNKRDTQVRDVFFPPDFDGIKDEEFPVSLLLSLSFVVRRDSLQRRRNDKLCCVTPQKQQRKRSYKERKRA